MCIGILRSKPLDAFLIFQSFLHLFRESQKFRNIVAVLLLRDFSSHLCELNSQAVHGRKLCAVCLGRSNRNFRASKCVKHLVCFTSNTTTHYIDDCHCGNALFFCHTQCCQCICCLPRLADNYHQCLLVERHLTITELRCKFHTHRNIGHIFQYILSSHAHMPCGAAGNNIDLLEVLDFILGDLHARQVDGAVFNHGVNGILNSFRLLMDFLHHEMLKAAFFGSLGIPLDFSGLLLDLITVQVIEMSFTRSQFCELKVANVIHVASVFQNCRDIRSHIGLTIRNADDHRAILTCHPDLARIITEHQLKRIGTAHTNHRLGNGINRTEVVLFIIVVHQLDDHFRIRLTIECITVLQQLFFQFGIVLDDAVMYANDLRLHCAGTRTGTVT